MSSMKTNEPMSEVLFRWRPGNLAKHDYWSLMIARGADIQDAWRKVKEYYADVEREGMIGDCLYRSGDSYSTAREDELIERVDALVLPRDAWMALPVGELEEAWSRHQDERKRMRAENHEKAERAEYERLKKKFGG